jgi:hypothetical protein
MERLVYTRLGNDTVSIDLHNGYSIVAFELFNKEIKKYQVTFYIKDNEVSILDLIEKQNKVEFESDRTSINSIVLRHVGTLLSEGFYDYYMRRYDYMMKCFDKGNEIFENERLGNAI